MSNIFASKAAKDAVGPNMFAAKAATDRAPNLFAAKGASEAGQTNAYQLAKPAGAPDLFAPSGCDAESCTAQYVDVVDPRTGQVVRVPEPSRNTGSRPAGAASGGTPGVSMDPPPTGGGMPGTGSGGPGGGGGGSIPGSGTTSGTGGTSSERPPLPGDRGPVLPSVPVTVVQTVTPTWMYVVAGIAGGYLVAELLRGSKRDR